MEQENNIQQTVNKVLGDIAERRERAGNTEHDAGDSQKEFKKVEEITLKFGKGCVSEEFQGKDGKSYKEILIPNQDKDDHRPWQTFVVKSNHVHENKYGKGMWCKLPAEGHTTVRRSVVVGEKPDGSKEWGTEKTTVSNRDLKKMVEAYKDRPRESVKEKHAEKKAEAAKQTPAEKTPKKSMEAAL